MKQYKKNILFLSILMRFVHDAIFPVVCHLSQNEDRDLLACANYLHETKFSADQLGLPEDFCVPLIAAVSSRERQTDNEWISVFLSSREHQIWMEDGTFDPHASQKDI